MKQQLYKSIKDSGFRSIGLNQINHSDILKCFIRDEEDLKEQHYIEIYKNFYGVSVHIYGKGFMKNSGHLPTIFHIENDYDIDILKAKLKK
jgi:phosphoribosyl-AMP cyclohydrolase